MKYLMIVIVVFSVPVQAMKRLGEQEGEDWYSAISFLDKGTCGRNKPRYTYFLPEKDQNRFKIPSDYLLWAKKMNDDKGVLQDITDHILRYLNACIILSDKPFMDKVKRFDINESDIVCLNKEQRQGLWYILSHAPEKPIEIYESAEFSQKMVKNIQSLPEPIKRKIVKTYGDTIKATMHHTLLCGADCLDDKKNRDKCIKCGLIYSCGFVYFIGISILLSPCCTLSLLGSVLYRFRKNLYQVYTMPSYNLSIFCETPEEREERLRLVEIPLLQEMKFEIAEK